MLYVLTVMFEKLFSSSGLSLERLRSFVRVADAGGIAKASGGDAVKQSQFSRQLRELETYFGAELTRRRGKTLALSEHGLRLAAIIRHELQALDDFRREMADQPRVFTLGAGGSALDWLVAPAFPKLTNALPGAVWRLEGLRSRDLVERIRDGRLDFALVRQDAVPTGQPMKKLGSLRYIAALPRAMARAHAGKDKLTLADLARLPLAVPTTEGQFHEALTAAFDKANLPLRPVVECQGFLQVRALIMAGSCAAVMPSIAPLDGVFTFALPQLAEYRRTLVLHWNQRQMERRGIGPGQFQAIASALMPELK